MTGDARLPRFNFDTMSGVYPGTRTQVFQRLLLRRADASQEASPAPAEGAPNASEAWALLYWYEDPASVVIRLEGAPAEESASLADPLAQGDFVQSLDTLLTARGWHPYICGVCAHWQQRAGVTTDGLPLGECRLRRKQSEESVEIPLLLSAQSALAMGCPHWLEGSGASGVNDDALPMHPLPKVAEISESKMKPMRRLRHRLAQWLNPPSATPPLADRLIERSGVGAGTESCPCCQGRIANLGALAVEDDAGDKQTLSVWRCRICHTLFLSDWIDRWERVDSLETEEALYRIAPVEAAEMLTLITSVAEAEHPRRRGERTAERAWFLAQVAGRKPVSHVIKQGR